MTASIPGVESLTPAPIRGASIHRHVKNLWRIIEPDLDVRETGRYLLLAGTGHRVRKTTRPTTAVVGLSVTFSNIRVLTAS
ncbi:hypothetical protein [Micromonospora sp. NPDC005220]|uniref:hypothetical protein n=1 Tax=Micromonospora sp. NPDC005220 TaxID=3155589 RepID=UPI0033AFE2AE